MAATARTVLLLALTAALALGAAPQGSAAGAGSAPVEAVAPAGPEPSWPRLEDVPAGQTSKQPPYCTKSTGPRQRELERHLRLRVDGRQSPADCAALARFQSREGILPAIGYAGEVTWGRIVLRGERARPNRGGRCPWTARPVACVDLDRQIMWVQRKGRAVFGPVPVRTGRPAYPTRPGRYAIGVRNRDHYSTLYQAPMPYAQFFDGGQAFHGTWGSVYREPASHGCVNLRMTDAAALWKVLRQGDEVVLWGRRP
ncbi:L,D-transpeptidase [Streptomyces sp. NPDC001941]|uniref:L,D-transpeptidase family protein n=1 Tax=Streptomyces sp. NPDC001941 TaxID=3154659 RepID=UPI003320D2D8